VHPRLLRIPLGSLHHTHQPGTYYRLIQISCSKCTPFALCPAKGFLI
jgi:hypothetical protein